MNIPNNDPTGFQKIFFQIFQMTGPSKHSINFDLFNNLATNMPDSNNILPIYFDQNIISKMREGEKSRTELITALGKTRTSNVVFVYSSVHVDECRAAKHVAKFAQVLEELSFHFLEPVETSDQKIVLSPGKARELLLEPEGAAQIPELFFWDNSLKFLHFSRGWLDCTQERTLKDGMIADATKMWQTLQIYVDQNFLRKDFENLIKQYLVEKKFELEKAINDEPFEDSREQFVKHLDLIAKNLPKNLAQLDEIPDELAVENLLACFDDQHKNVFQEKFPKDFWRQPQGREVGKLSGLALTMFLYGLVRKGRVKSGDAERRMKYFRAQFRDGLHIENAARCAAVFVTLDKGAARLARCLYSYAGVQTGVVHLKIDSAN